MFMDSMQASADNCCIFLALLLLPHSGQMQLLFRSPYLGKSVTGLIGHSVTFVWTFSGAVDTVTWRIKETGVDASINGRLVVLDERGVDVLPPLSVLNEYRGRVSGNRSGDSVSGQATFTLCNITKDDERFYGCFIKPDDPNHAIIVDFVHLFVVEVPTIIYPTAENASYNEGSHVNITCAATGKPAPEVRWTHNGQVKSSGQNATYLSFCKTDKKDAGIYTCIANNSAGRIAKQLKLEVNHPATIHNITSSMANSWIGHTVTLLCKADGVPVPTLSWYKPDGTKFNEVKTYESTAVLTMNTEHDFGLYNCTADNGFPLASKMIQVKQIKAPSLPNIAIDVQATSMTVKWTVPADNGGSTVTAYRVVLLQQDKEIDEKNVTDPVTKTCVFTGLRKSTIYSLRVSARNFVFEGPFSQTTVQTKPQGLPEAALIKDLPAETKDVTVKLMWDEPQNNGAPITKYTVYQRIVNNSSAPREWSKIRIITDVSVREVAVKLEKGREYEFLVTASNRFGESVKEEKNTRKIAALGDVPAVVEITDEIILYWDKPNSNGAAITRYSIYQRVGNEWKLIGVIHDISKREYVLEIENGKVYEFVITATNKYGESSLEENIKWIQVLSGSNPAGNQTGSVRNSEGLLHGVYASCILLLLIFTFTLIFFIWKMRLRLELTNSRRKINIVKGKEFVNMEPIAAQDEPVTQPSSSMEYDDVVGSATPGSGDYMPLHPLRRSWEITRQQVNIIKVIGKGAFSEVAKATLWNLRENQKVITVAAKMLRANAPDSDRKDLLSELELMKKLKPHPHVIKLMACVTETDPVLVLIEFVPFGDLLGYLRKSRGLSDTYFLKDPDIKRQTSLTAEQLMKFAWQVADGMCYLSSRKIIHRDLAARNVLVGEGEMCKVTDFGMARNVHQDDIYTRKSRGRLPVKWTAYEALLYGVYTTQSDVWSYGILLYEILTVGGSPYPDVKARQIADRLQQGYRMPRPKHVDDTLYQLMLKCWEEQPTDRPTFNKLRKTMKEMEKKHKTYLNLSQYDNRLYANVDDLIEEEQDEVKSRSVTQF